MRHQLLSPGSTVELIDHAHVIPAGTYTFVRRHDELLVFSVTPQVGFVLASSYWEHLIRPVFTSKRNTDEATFLSRYAALHKRQDSQVNTIPQAAISACFMGKSALKRVTRYLSPDSKPIAIMKHPAVPQRATTRAA